MPFVVLRSVLYVFVSVLMEASAFGNVMSVSGNFVFHRVIREEINGCIRCGWFADYVDFKVRRLSNYRTSRKLIHPLLSYVRFSFMSVCIWFIYLLMRLEFVRLVSYMIKMLSTYLVYNYMFFVSKSCSMCVSSECFRNTMGCFTPGIT